ncbi:MAG: alanine racemase [Alphaproteobacteria bacterium]|nr:MAG: alanine racemase [Alphaproteobacteria bacterium]
MTAARLDIDLTAIVRNWRTAAAGRRADAVIKADGYGLGALEVGRALVAAGCSRLFVAHLSEAVVLRAALPAPEIAVLNGLTAGSESAMRAHRLLPVLNDGDQLHRWTESGGGPALLHIDTGMERLGVAWADAPAVLASPAIGRASLVGVLSHLAVADEPNHPLNAVQLARMREIAAALPGVEASLAASSGCFLGREFGFDRLRPGAALFGIAPLPGQPNPLAAVVRLQAPVIAVRWVEAGTSVGYGASWVAPRRSRIATLALGYADGYLRHGSNRGRVWFGDQAAPLVGRVSMDLITIDTTDLADPPVPGDWAEVIGPHRPVDTVAADLGTIGYEVLTNLGQRFQRRYHS